MDKLDQGLSGKLTLASAPAGFGKTTLITAWLSQIDPPVAWVSLDEDDSDPQQFFRYIGAGIQPFLADRQTLSELLQSSQPQPAKALATALVNDCTAVSTPCLLVLDDYHAVDSAEIDLALAFLLDHLPPNLHLVITSRSDPGFPLSRLRARNQLTEIRADDLRFTTEETAVFLQSVMGVTLSPEQISSLEARTEGWIAGLQMAAISVKNQADVDAFVTNFTGSHRFIMDYLVEEVLNQRPVDVQEFLLETAVLTRLSADLCDAVRQSPPTSQKILEQLESDNIFLIPLDNERRWYRYHHLFADLLRIRLAQEQPDLAPRLHQRASDWYATNGRSNDAIHHALAAPDFELAAQQIELVWRSMDRSFQEKTWLSWAQALPEAFIRMRPVLCTGYAWALLDTGQAEQIELANSLLDQAEQWLETPTADMVVVDQKEFESLPATIAAARAYMAQAVGDLPATMRYAQQTLDLLPPDDHFYRGVPSITLAMAQWTNGELSLAFQSASDAANSFQIADNLLFELSTKSVMAEIKAAQGELNEGVTIYNQALQQLTRSNETLLRTAVSLHRGLGKLLYKQGDLEGAKQHFDTCQNLSNQAGVGDVDFRLFVAQALLKRSEGDLTGAIELLDKAQATFTPGRILEFAPITALKSRMLIADGRLAAAEQWSREQVVTLNEELSYLREYEHLTLARLLLARYQQDGEPADLDSAQELLGRLLSAAENGGRMGRAAEILILQASAYALQHETSAWQATLSRALTLARPQSMVQLFIDEGLPVQQLLLKLKPENPGQKAFCRKLLAAFDLATSEPVKSQPLVDPLSERELEILTHVARGLKNKEIAAELFVSVNTIHYHTKNIYSKLGVNSRTKAIAKAKSLKLLE